MKKVAVIMGGSSCERDISLISGEGVVESLKKSNYEVIKIDIIKNDTSWIKKIIDEKPQVIFNALHGTFGEDGIIQGVLEYLNIPYTHSGVRSSVLCMDKSLSKILFEKNSILTPKWDYFKINSDISNVNFQYPFVIKPISEGSSVGVYIVRNSTELSKLASDENILNYKSIIEEYLTGREIQITLLDGKAVGSIEIKPKKNEFYDYETKYTNGMADHICPAIISKEDEIEAFRISEKAYKVLGCRGLARADLILSNNKFYLLEINTQPGLTPLSLAPETVLKNINMSYEDLIIWCINDASINR